MLFLANCGRVNCSGAQLSVTQPLLHHVERDACGDSCHPESVPKSFGAGLRTAGDAGGVHNGFHLAPGCGPANIPKADLSSIAPTLLGLPDIVHQIESIEQSPRNRHGAIHALTALLECFEDDQSAGEVHAVGRQRERLRNAAAGKRQHAAEGPHFARCFLGRFEKCLPLVGSQIFPLAILIKQLS